MNLAELLKNEQNEIKIHQEKIKHIEKQIQFVKELEGKVFESEDGIIYFVYNVPKDGDRVDVLVVSDSSLQLADLDYRTLADSCTETDSRNMYVMIHEILISAKINIGAIDAQPKNKVKKSKRKVAKSSEGSQSS